MKRETYIQMKKETNAQKNILTAFLLNICFVIIEIFGGLFTGSVAILSDAIHDFGDSVAVGSAYFLEKFSHNKPSKDYTYGYRRYSIVSAIINSTVLLIGSGIVVYSAVLRLFNPAEPKSGWMMIFAVFGIAVNGYAAYRTSHSDNINEHTISLHMLEDVLGWVVVFIGSLVMFIFKGYAFAPYIDPIMSLLVTAFIVYNIVINLRNAFRILLERAPAGFDTAAYRASLEAVDGVISVHHLHVWSFDGESTIATLHAVVPDTYNITEVTQIKQQIIQISQTYGISHVTVQTDAASEPCTEPHCRIGEARTGGHHHGHHH